MDICSVFRALSPIYAGAVQPVVVKEVATIQREEQRAAPSADTAGGPLNGIERLQEKAT